MIAILLFTEETTRISGTIATICDDSNLMKDYLRFSDRTLSKYFAPIAVKLFKHLNYKIYYPNGTRQEETKSWHSRLINWAMTYKFKFISPTCRLNIHITKLTTYIHPNPLYHTKLPIKITHKQCILCRKVVMETHTSRNGLTYNPNKQK